MTYNAIPHLNSNNSIRRGLTRVDHKTGKLISHTTFQFVRNQPRAVDVKRAERAARKLESRILNP